MTWSPRENLQHLWRRQGYEYAPVMFSLCPSQEAEFKRRFGASASYEEFYRFPWRTVGASLLRQDFTDWARFFPGAQFNPGTAFSIWGMAHEPAPGAHHMTRMHHPMRPFTSLEQFQSYPYPEFDPSQTDRLRREVEQCHAAGLAATASMACTVWEAAWYMRGMEELMIDLLEDSPLAEYHLERITALACRRAAAYAAAGVDHLHLGDDIGMQHSIMMAIPDYRRWLKPRLARVIAAARAAQPRLLISYHSCGYIAPFIPDLIECGIDVLNPVQPECMDFAAIHAEYGSVLSFWGTVGTQTTMPFGSPDDVHRVVRANLKLAGPAGGLLCTPTHLVEPEVPWGNIAAYVDACREFAGHP